MTTRTTLTRPLADLLAAASLAALMLGMTAAPALADELIASDTSPMATAPNGTIQAPTITAAATVPSGIVVANHAGQVVRLFAKGEPIRRGAHPGRGPVTFTGLTPGRTYTVEVGGVRVGSLTAIARPTPASGLTVRTTAERGSVALSWRHRPTLATGGRSVTYVVTATSRTAPTLRQVTTGRVATTLTGLDRNALYTFTVVPRNSAGAGKGTRAVMTRRWPTFPRTLRPRRPRRPSPRRPTQRRLRPRPCPCSRTCSGTGTHS